MPRIRSKWKDYSKKRIKLFVKNSLYESDMKQYQLAEKMNMSPNNFSNKLKAGRFSYIDIVEMFDIFGTPDEERLRLLRPEVRRSF